MPDSGATILSALRHATTPAQEGVLLAEQAIGAAGSHNIALLLRCSGSVDVVALRRVIRLLSSRHQALQTSIRTDGEQFVQITDASAPPIELEYDDAPMTEADQWVAHRMSEPFELQRAPLARALYRTTDANTTLLLLIVHHGIADGRSLEVLRDDIVGLYRSLTENEDLPASSAISYVDFVRDASRRRQLAPATRTKEYWRRELEEPPALTELPTLRRTVTSSRRAATLKVAVPPAVTAQLRQIARQREVSNFALASSAAAALMMRYVGRTDVTFGVPFLSRLTPGTQDLVALTVNTLPLRLVFSSEVTPTFLDLSRAINIKSLKALVHQNISFDALLRIAKPERVPGRQPLMQIGLNHTVIEETAPPVGGVQFETLPAANGTAALELMINYVESGSESFFYLEYDTAIYDAASIERFAQHLLVTLRLATSDLTRRIDDFDYLSDDETHALLEAGFWLDKIDAPQDTAYGRFKQVADNTPGATAIEFREMRWTYKQLDDAVALAAHRLREAGVTLGSVVGVSLHRNPLMIATLLAVLRIGAAYVPLDPTYPPERLEYIRDHAELQIIVVDSETCGVWTEKGVDTVLRVDAHPSTTETFRRESEQRNDSVDPTTPAYILYTSGSTGKPKGVVGLNSNLVYLAEWAAKEFKDDLWRVLGATSLNFDVSVFEIFATLLNGGCVSLVPDHLSLTETAGWTGGLICIVPSVLSALLSSGDTAIQSQAVLTGGERLSQALATRTIEAMPNVRLINGYGPTESGVYATRHVCSSTVTSDPPIGRPIPGAQLAVLDTSGRLVPFGCVGELYIGGNGLSGGYLNAPHLTKERFYQVVIRDSTKTMYRTGDIVRWDDDQNLHFVSRIDDQVKVRGVRVELAEVESALASLPFVSQAAVTFSPARQTLTGYVVIGATEIISSAHVRAALGNFLPRAMLPSEINFLPSMPLTANGKIDRRALRSSKSRQATHVPFASSQEQALAAILAEVLGLDSVERHDNFFDLGGHSLHAFAFVQRVNDELGSDLSMKQFLAAPTIADTADRVGAVNAVSDYSVLLPLRESADGSPSPWFCIHPGFGLSWSYANLLPHVNKTTPMFGLQARGFASNESLPLSFSELVDDYVDMMVATSSSPSIRLLGWSYGGLVAFTAAHRLQDMGIRVESLVLLDPHIPNASERPDTFDLSEAGQLALESVLSVAPDREQAAAVIANLARIQPEFEAQPYNGDMLLIPASDGLTPEEVGTWQSLVKGETVVRPIEFGHYDMMSQTAAAEVAAVIESTFSTDGKR